MKVITREQVQEKILAVLAEDFEIINPDLDDNLGEKYEFDSIDAIDLLVIIEKFLATTLSTEEKKGAVKIRTIRQIIDYVAAMAERRVTS